MAGKRKELTPKQAVALLDRRREQQRLANAAQRELDRAAGLTLIQVKAPADAGDLLREIAEALREADRGKMEAAADKLARYKPLMRQQSGLDLDGE